MEKKLPKIRGTVLGRYHQDYSILGSILEIPLFCWSIGLRVQGFRLRFSFEFKFYGLRSEAQFMKNSWWSQA